MIVNNEPYPISFEMEMAQSLVFRYGEEGRQYSMQPDVDVSGLVASLQIVKPDNTFVIASADIAEPEEGPAYIVLTIPVQATVVKGMGHYSIFIRDDADMIIYSAEGQIWIDDHLITDEMIESASEVYGLRFPQDFLTVDNLVDIVNYVSANLINDETIAENTTWSSQKIDQELSGIEPEPITATEHGNPIEITDAAAAPLVKCVTAITGSQNLNGYDKPWVGGAEKNKLPLVLANIKSANTGGTWSDNNYTFNGIVFTINVDNANNIIGIKTSGASTAQTEFILCWNNVYSAGDYILSGCPSGGSTLTYWLTTGIGLDDVGTGKGFTSDGTTRFTTKIFCRANIDMTGLTFYPMIRLSTVTDPTFAPYSNICPITAYTEGEIEVSDGDGNVTTHTTTYPSAIYRGSEDCVNGTATTEWGMIASYAGETLPGQWISDRDEYVPGTTPTTGAQVAYELATPTTSSVTPTNLPIKSLSGYTHIESSTGDMEVEYITPYYQPLADIIERGDMHHYSTVERVIGKWMDESPVYEKTISFGALPNNTTKSVAHGIDNLDLIISCGGFAKNASNTQIPIPYVNISSAIYQSTLLVNATNVQIMTASDLSGYSSSYITIRYTKTS